MDVKKVSVGSWDVIDNEVLCLSVFLEELKRSSDFDSRLTIATTYLCLRKRKDQRKDVVSFVVDCV